MGTQGNSVFTLKDVNTYVEKWTGRGGAVGSASVSQELTSLPPGNYELTVAAQNIQEDTPNAAQSGAYIFAGSAKTVVTVRDTYKVAFDFISGTVPIGFQAVDATGNWLAVDDFRLALVGTDLSAPLGETIAVAEALYGDGSGKQAGQLMAAIEAARSVASNVSATGQEQADTIVALETAINIYWNNLSSIHGFGISVTYSPAPRPPTAAMVVVCAWEPARVTSRRAPSCTRPSTASA